MNTLGQTIVMLQELTMMSIKSQLSAKRNPNNNFKANNHIIHHLPYQTTLL